MNDLTKNTVLWVVIAVVMMFVFTTFSNRCVQPHVMPYSQFLTEVKSGSVRAGTVKEDTIVGKRATGEACVAFNPETDNTGLSGLLQQQGGNFDAGPPERRSCLVIMASSSIRPHPRPC